MPLTDATQLLAQAITDANPKQFVIVTGAGISLASGIPTFRGSDPDAIWHRDIMELGTNAYFESDPVSSWHWYTSRFDSVLDKKPNAAHQAVADLEQWQRQRGEAFILVTQNVDTLHEDAGSDAMVKVHGTADRTRCVRYGCVNGAPYGSLSRQEVNLAAFIAEPIEANLPRCPECHSLVRQHVLWFDELYDGHADYQWNRVVQSASAADFLLFVGTSFAVGVTELFLQSGLSARCPMFAIDPGTDQPPNGRVTLLREKSEELLPRLHAQLAARS